MTKKKVLIIGAGGMAGHMIAEYFESNTDYCILKTSRKASDGCIYLDVFDAQRINAILVETQPDFVVNCVGLLVKESNDCPDKAIYVNAYWPHLLSKSAKDFGFKLIHISTDCVFSGAKGNYSESDAKDGKDYYAKSKALGELENDRDLTIRTSIIGPELKDGTGLFHWFMTQKSTVQGYSKVFWTGLTTLELAKVINEAINEDLVGLYNVVPKTKISKFDLLGIINRIFLNNKLNILEDSTYICDKSLVTERTEFRYNVPDYDQMVEDLFMWMKQHRDLYYRYITK